MSHTNNAHKQRTQKARKWLEKGTQIARDWHAFRYSLRYYRPFAANTLFSQRKSG